LGGLFLSHLTDNEKFLLDLQRISRIFWWFWQQLSRAWL
jgi:hypothetical protein